MDCNEEEVFQEGGSTFQGGVCVREAVRQEAAQTRAEQETEEKS